MDISLSRLQTVFRVYSSEVSELLEFISVSLSMYFEDMMDVLESWMPTARKHSHLRSVLVEIERLWVDCSVLLVRLPFAMDGDPEFVVTSETEVLSKQILLKHSELTAIMNRVMGESQPKSLKRKASGLCDDEGADDDGGAQSSMQA